MNADLQQALFDLVRITTQTMTNVNGLVNELRAFTRAHHSYKYGPLKPRDAPERRPDEDHW